ncbi:MAG: hypothetical protein JO211_15945, partial [Acidobacteriaceae bacterium]|nr:hypothetical protein [Acidobacteriaceae bacterium]
MKASQPPVLATRLLERLAPGPHGDALACHLIQQYREGHSTVWYWRQALFGIVVCFAKDRTLGGAVVLACLLVLLLMIVSVCRHPASLGSGMLIVDIALLSGYGVFSIWGWQQRGPELRDALTAGARAGLMLGFILVASHAVEWFGLDRNRTAQFARGAGSTLLMVGLLGAAASAAWERTRSIKLGVVAGLWCGSLGAMVLLSFAFALNLVFQAHSAAWLHEAFVASGMRDPGAFMVRNSLAAVSEILVRLPIAAFVLSFSGGLVSSWIMMWPRILTVLAAWFTPFIFAAGAASLW